MPEITALQNAREATFEERATWGTCPVCKAAPGEWCDSAVGIPLGISPSGTLREGAHLGRLANAPTRIKLVAAS